MPGDRPVSISIIIVFFLCEVRLPDTSVMHAYQIHYLKLMGEHGTAQMVRDWHVALVRADRATSQCDVV